MSEERQKSQEQLAFAFVGGSEAPLGEREGAEAPMVRREAEDPAGNQRMMEEVCERGNRRKALMLISARLDFRHWSRVASITIRTAVYGTVRTVVWEGRRSDPSPYPDPKARATGRRRCR